VKHEPVITYGTVVQGKRLHEARHVRTTSDTDIMMTVTEIMAPGIKKWITASRTTAGTFNRHE
jgi:hypothetical protein